jgi:hypothetical protein
MPSRFMFLVGCLLLLGALTVSSQHLATRAAALPTMEEGRIVECRAMESHSSPASGTTIVLFHHNAEESKKHLSDLLKENSGATVEWQAGAKWPGDAAKWRPATLFRLKNCFGRGLLLLPSAADAPRDGETFLVKFPSEKQSE